MKALVIAIVIALFSACSTSPDDVATESAALNVGSPLCFKPGGDALARYPWEATYPLGNQHVFCQHMVAETNSFQWPNWASQCVGAPGVHQVDVYVKKFRANGTPNGEFCTRVNIPSVPAIYPLHADYVETMELGWLASSPRWVSRFVMGPSTAVVMSSLPNVWASGCVPSSACVNYVNGQFGGGNVIQVDNLLTAYSWMMEQAF